MKIFIDMEIYKIYFEPLLLFIIYMIIFFFILSIVLILYTFILRINNYIKTRRLNRLEKQWKQIIMDILYKKRPIDDLRNILKKQDELYLVNFVFKISLNIKGEDKKILSEIAYPYLKKIEQNFKSNEVSKRIRSIFTLSELAINDYSHIIKQALDDSSPLVVMIALKGLCKNRKIEYIKDIVKKLDKLRNFSHKYIISLIAELGPEICKTLREEFINESNSQCTRVIVGEVLRKLNDMHSIQMAKQILEKETNHYELIATCLKIFTEFPSQENKPLIKKYINHNKFFIKIHSLLALEKIIENEDDYNLIYNCLKDKNIWVVLRAAQILKRKNRMDLLEKFIKEKHFNVKHIAYMFYEKAKA